MITPFKIDSRTLGPGHPVFIVAELSANHNHDFDNALRVVEAAAEVGADAIKLQTYTPDTMTIDCQKPLFQIGKGTIWEGKNLYQLYREAFTPWDWHADLFMRARELGITMFSTPFDHSSVDFLEQFNPPAYKIASFELIDHGLLTKVAGTGRPVFLSTGMASLAEIDEAVGALRANGCNQLALLKCTSAYPSAPESMNLRTIPHISATYDVPVGLSDHTMGIAVAIAAVAQGACLIEKHFTLSRDEAGPDSPFSLEPHEFKELVDSVRVAEKALGKVSFQLTKEEEVSKSLRRSLFVVENVKQGEVFTAKNVRSIRPAHGLPPAALRRILGKVASRDIERGTPLAEDLLS